MTAAPPDCHSFGIGARFAYELCAAGCRALRPVASPRGPSSISKPRILIVNCFSDNHRGAHGNPLFVPQPMIASVLAGQVQRDKADVKVWCEFSQGPLENLQLLRWADLLVLTGLNAAFDRMKHLAAYARTVNPDIAVAMGGSAARALPRLSRRYFDYVCTGDVEQLAEVLDDVFGPGRKPSARFRATT